MSCSRFLMVSDAGRDGKVVEFTMGDRLSSRMKEGGGLAYSLGRTYSISILTVYINGEYVDQFIYNCHV